MAVLNIGGVNVDAEQKAIGVGDNMPFAPVNALAGVVASRAAGLGRRCALTVNHRCRWPGLTSKFPAGLPDQNSDDLLPPSGIAPSIKIALNRRVRRNSFGSARHWHPVDRMKRIACTIMRKSTSLGRPR